MEEINIFNTIDALKKEQKLIELQGKYEHGIVLEEDLSDNEKEQLTYLYERQIKTLEENVSIYKQNLELYEKKIIKIRNQLSHNDKK